MSKFYKCCPHCGSTSGLYVKFEAVEFLNYDGTPAGYSDNYTKQGRMCYCNACGKSVCRKSTWEKVSQ